MPATVPSPALRDRPARGFSIAELLSAIVVLAVGILGVVALYVDRVHEQEHSPRSIATALAEEMAQDIRARASSGTATRLQIAPFCTQLPKNTDDSGTTSGNAAKTHTVAQDAACWQDKVAHALPNGTGMVEREDPSQGYRITVSWSEAGVGASSLVMRVD